MTKKSLWTELVQPEDRQENFQSLANGIERASTVVFKNVQSMRQRNWRDKAQYSYGLQGTPTTRKLERKLAAMEGGKHCILTPSGLAAISLTMLALLKRGERVLIPDNTYEPAAEVARYMAANFGIEWAWYDPSQPGSIEFTANTRLLWTETPGSLTMEVADLPVLAAAAHKHGALVAVDATWSAGLAMRTFDLGADISIQALTKYQSGGSDVLMGSIVLRDDKLHNRLLDANTVLGLGVSPEDCGLVLRSLPHLRLRYEAQDNAARKVAAWLQEQPQVEAVLHPALPDSPGHDIWRRDFSGAASLFSVAFQPEISQARIDAFVDALELFHVGFSWGGAVSLALPFEMNKTHRDFPYKGGLVRFYIGLESSQDLIDDLINAFKNLN
ncbi:MAG TPA: cystathionine beta-lyase [Methylophilaceae bacterium]|nr:cystathionine beta-lyase [Methylophilaceae bacterium]